MIKNLLLSSLLLASTVSIAQTAVPNGAMENWTNSGFYMEPTSWGTANGAIALGAPVTVARSTDKHGGTYAAKLETVSFDFNGVTTTLPGFMLLGTVDVFNQETVNGRPFTAKPDSIGFWYKYAPVNGDDLNVFGELSRWDATSQTHETIATFEYSSDAAKTVYTYQSAAFEYASNDTPDSLTIVFSSSSLQGGGQVGSVLFVDDVTAITNGTVSVPSKSESVFKLYPNPAKDVLYVTLPKEATIEIYNVLGSKVETLRSNGTDKTTINIADYNNGVYILKTSSGITQRFVVKH